MKNRIFSVGIFPSAIAVAMSLAACSSESGTEYKVIKPNIILIFLDDAGYADFGATGSSTPTPTIDALAKNGVQKAL